MIGQEKNKQLLRAWTHNGTMPQFLILVGPRGSGKKLLAHYIAENLGKDYIWIGTSVDGIREMISLAATVNGVYVIEDADTMSTNAKNAMLKIVEEPPADTYFIMTVTDDTALLGTITSRARVMYMESYYTKELMEYRNDLPAKCYEYANNPWQLDVIGEYGEPFFSFVEIFVANIKEVESANAFKALIRLAVKSEEGYDISIFMQAVIAECLRKEEYVMAICTSSYAKSLERVGVNKQQLLDAWIFNLRAAQ